MRTTTTDRETTAPSKHRVESKEKRRQRLSTGGLIAVIGVLLLVALGSTTGDGPVRSVRRIRRGPAAHLDRARGRHGRGLRRALPAPAAGFLSGRMPGRMAAVAGTVAGLAPSWWDS